MDLRTRALCSLLLRNYDNSLNDFLVLNEREKQTKTTSDVTYMSIALCYYALGDNEKAIDFFCYPLTNKKEIKYTSDTSLPPSVLLFIGTKLGRPNIVKIATKELKRLSKYETSASTYLLGLTTDEELNSFYEEHSHEILRNRKECKAEFYRATLGLINGNFESYREHLNRCVALKGNYLEFEYYIAKIELKKLNSH